MWQTIEPAGRNARRQQLVTATCSCGTVRIVVEYNLKRGRSVSCGCHKVKTGHTAGGTASRTYVSWTAMRTRCQNENSSDYPEYGGRGITVVPEWNQFEQFLQDMGERPVGCTLDRIEVDGNYGPGNCRWATHKVQRANQRQHKRSVKRV